jgi:hypothetical protein
MVEHNVEEKKNRQLPANNLRRISTMYVRGYLQGSENGRVVTIGTREGTKLQDHICAL